MSASTRLGRRIPAVLAVLAVPATLLALATPAEAVTGSITKPSDGAVVSSGDTFDITAQLSRGLFDSAAVVLTLTPPGGTAQEIDRASGSDVDLKYTFDPRCCSGRSWPNGTYTVKLSGGSANDTNTFVLHAPPSPPSGVNASATGQRQIAVSWQTGPEPDLVSYDVFERTSSGYATLATNLSATTTSYVVNYPDAGYGGDHTFAVRSRRRACPTCAETIDSSLSQSNRVSLSEPTPEPDPTESPSSGGGDDGTTTGNGNGGNGNGNGNGKKDDGGSTSGPTSGPSAEPTADPYAGGNDNGGKYSSGKKSTTTAAQQRQRVTFGLNFKNFAPKLGAPKLPPLPRYAEAPRPEGTYNPSLPYGSQSVRERVAGEKGTARQIVDTLVSSVFEGERLWRSIAWALILLLGAAHLRRWLRVTATD